MAHIVSHIDRLQIEQHDDGIRATLLKEFVVRVNSGRVVVVPAGFITDFASVPPWLWWVIHPVGRYARAAVIHDYLYKTGQGSRAEADHIFLELMERLGVMWLVRKSMYQAVRTFGGVPWDRYRKSDP